MTLTLVPGSRVTRDVPAHVLALSALPRVDYADRFTLATTVTAPPERWARAMFGDVPDLGGRLIWRGALGFRLTRGRSPSTIGGWRIGGRGEDWIRLETGSWYLRGNMLVQTGGGQVTWTTCLQYERPLGRAVWVPASAVHRRLVPRVLRGAAARLEVSGG